MVKSVLHSSERRVRLLFANQDRDSAIFARVLDELESRFGDRFTVHHHRDDEDGLVDEQAVASFLGSEAAGEFYVCGPSGFMAVVHTGLERAGVEPDRIHIERFTPPATPAVDPPATTTSDGRDARSLTITIGTETKTVRQRDKLTILESARWNGLAAPSSCEAGHCATCMAMVVEGEVAMEVNDILTDDEVAEGWVLTCQTVPVSPVVRVVYEP
jgi:ferredoxin-NADP reductase